MSKASKSKPLKLPKRLLGVKVPKDARRKINRVLKLAPRDAAKPLIAMAVGSVAVALADKLEGPLHDLLKHSGSAPLNPTNPSGKSLRSDATH